MSFAGRSATGATHNKTGADLISAVNGIEKLTGVGLDGVSPSGRGISGSDIAAQILPWTVHVNLSSDAIDFSGDAVPSEFNAAANSFGDLKHEV